MAKSFSFSYSFIVYKSYPDEMIISSVLITINYCYCVEKRSNFLWGEWVHSFPIFSPVKLFDSQHGNTNETPAPSLHQFEIYLKCEYRICSNKANCYSMKHILIQMKEKNRITWAELIIWKSFEVIVEESLLLCQWCIHKINYIKWKGSVINTLVDYEMLSTKMSINFLTCFIFTDVSHQMRSYFGRHINVNNTIRCGWFETIPATCTLNINASKLQT